MGKLQFYWNIAILSSENQNSIFPAAYLEDSGPFFSFSLKKSKDFKTTCRGAEHKLEDRKKAEDQKGKVYGLIDNGT